MTPWTTHLGTADCGWGGTGLPPSSSRKIAVLCIILTAYRKKGPKLTIYQARCAKWTGYAADRIRIKGIPGREMIAVALTHC